MNASVFHLAHNTDFIFTKFIFFQFTLSTAFRFHWNILYDNDADSSHKYSTPDLLGGLFKAMCGLDASVAGYKECITPSLMKKTQTQTHHLQHLHEFTALIKPYNA